MWKLFKNKLIVNRIWKTLKEDSAYSKFQNELRNDFSSLFDTLSPSEMYYFRFMKYKKRWTLYVYENVNDITHKSQLVVHTIWISTRISSSLVFFFSYIQFYFVEEMEIYLCIYRHSYLVVVFHSKNFHSYSIPTYVYIFLAFRLGCVMLDIFKIFACRVYYINKNGYSRRECLEVLTFYFSICMGFDQWEKKLKWKNVKILC